MNEAAGGAETLSGLPDLPYLIVVKNAVAFSGLTTFHATDDWAAIIVVSL
jgi:hypothetical protein